MKKEDIADIFAYLIIFAGALIYLVTFLLPHFKNSIFPNGFMYALFVLGATAAGVVANAILYEVGHIIGAKMGGYEILSVCILHLCFYKNENNKIRFRFSNFDGFLGETKILPKKDNANPNHYLLLGTLLSVILTAGLVAAFVFTKDLGGEMPYFYLTAAVVGGACLFYNVLPFKMGTINDGYRLSTVSNPRNREAFNELLRVEYAIAHGDESVEIKTFTELTNYTASLNMNKVYMLLEQKEFAKAMELVDIVLANKDEVSDKVYLRATANKIYLSIMTLSKEEAAKYVEENVDISMRKSISDDVSMPSIRAYILVSGLFDNSKSECVLVLQKLTKAYKRVPKNHRKVELELFNDALKMVDEAHPKWEIMNFELIDDSTKK